MISDIKIEWFIWDTEWLQRFVLETGDRTLDQGARRDSSRHSTLIHTGLLSMPRMATNPQPNSQSDTDNNGSQQMKKKKSENNELPINIQLWHLKTKQK